MKTGTDTIRPSSIVHRPSGGFTLVEMLVVLAIVLILIGAAARLGQAVRTRAAARLTQSALAVIETALQQYYDDFGDFPFQSFQAGIITDTNGNGMLDEYIGMQIQPIDGVIPNNDYYFDSSAAVFYFLDNTPNSRSIISALTPSLITNKDAMGTPLVVQIPSGGSNRDLVRFIDSWGKSLWYRYEAGYSFPKLISAGPDKQFGTSDDIEN